MNVTSLLELVLASAILLGQDVALVALAALDPARRKDREPLRSCFFCLHFGHGKNPFRFFSEGRRGVTRSNRLCKGKKQALGDNEKPDSARAFRHWLIRATLPSAKALRVSSRNAAKRPPSMTSRFPSRTPATFNVS